MWVRPFLAFILTIGWIISIAYAQVQDVPTLALDESPSNCESGLSDKAMTCQVWGAVDNSYIATPMGQDKYELVLKDTIFRSLDFPQKIVINVYGDETPINELFETNTLVGKNEWSAEDIVETMRLRSGKTFYPCYNYTSTSKCPTGPPSTPTGGSGTGGPCMPDNPAGRACYILVHTLESLLIIDNYVVE